jgi:uncharacterized damage-inducible protein DinB
MVKDRRYPIGEFVFNPDVTPELRAEAISAIAALPRLMRAVVAPMTDAQVDTAYRPGGWTVRQVVHHVADSHINAYIRFRWALTEDVPTLKAYDEQAWAELPDAKTARVAISLDLLSALHARWVALLKRMTEDDFARRIVHPESGEQPLDRFLQLYAWHGRHHLAHIHLVADPTGEQAARAAAAEHGKPA